MTGTRVWLALGLASLAAAAVAGAAAPAVFTDVTMQSGIRFIHNNGGFGKKYLPETLGSGGLFLDVDGDGWQDILLINSKNWPGRQGGRSLPALYRNNRLGSFTDITPGSGLDVELYGIGGAAADFNNDGMVDIYVTALGGNRLFKNIGGGRFVDVTRSTGVGDGGFSTSALWVDYDDDGKLDLFVAHYVAWSEATDLTCTLDGKNKSYCTPESYRGQSPSLFHNRGDGTFENVSRRAGVYDTSSKGLGVAMLDFDSDGRNRHLRRERHRAEPSLSEPGQRPIRRCGGRIGRRLQRGGCRPRRDGRRRGRLRRHRPAQPDHR